MQDRRTEDAGRRIAQTAKIRRVGTVWVVPSETGSGSYVVQVDAAPHFCTCPRFETTGRACKHLVAVRLTIDGTANDAPIAPRGARKKYPINWAAYNASQTTERDHVARLLRGLCAGIGQPPQEGRGRRRLPLADAVFSCVMKVFVGFSGRRSMSDVRAYRAAGLIDAAPHYNSIARYLENPSLTPLLKALVTESALPLRAVESQFAVDSTGFSTVNHVSWFDKKFGRERRARKWVKCHIICGTKTQVVTEAEVTEGDANDSPEFMPLVISTARRFSVVEVSADKAYLSRENLAGVVAVGAAVYIPFKSNTTGDGPELWRRLFREFETNRDAWLDHYHRRSLSETAFWMIKSKYSAMVRSKTLVAQTNEVLCKLICHNLSCLTTAIFELGINPAFPDHGATTTEKK